jgi:hypothetical protein
LCGAQKRKVNSILTRTSSALTTAETPKPENLRIRHTTAQTASNQSRFKNFRAAHGAALWSLLFAALHVAWAAGWYVGLPAELARKAFQRTWFWAYDITAAVMCALGVVVALALARPCEQRLPRKIMNLFACCGAGLLLLRGGAGVIKIIYLALVTGRDVINTAALWEVWFCLGAALFSLAIWQSWHVKYS